MDKESVIATLRKHEPELRAAGIAHLRLHGSVARGDTHPESDVDLIADFDSSKRLSLLEMVGIEVRLAEILAVKVDLSPAKMLRQEVAAKAAEEAVVAF